MSEETAIAKRRRTATPEVEEDPDAPVDVLNSPPKQGPLVLLTPEESQETPTSSETAAATEAPEPEVDIVGEVEDEVDIVDTANEAVISEDEQERPLTPLTSPTHTSVVEEAILDESMKTPTKPVNAPPVEENHDAVVGEKIYSSFPCQVIPETLNRMTRTPPDGENLEVFRNRNGRLRIFVVDHFKKFSPYSNLTHKPCAVCNRLMKSGEMHLNFPADLDRRRIWANLLGFKYKDILRSKIGPVSLSVAAGPICTEHFAEECFRNHNFNKAAIEAFGVPVAISPDVKTTPSKKSSRVPWVCTICDFHSCSVVELQSHLIEHTEEMLKKKDGVLDVPEAGFMCPFCRKCTYGYKTISGYRRHLNAGPIQHCHLRRIYEFAKMNCRATELDPVESWEKWTRRNVYVAYHGCEPPANEIVLTPSPTKKAYVQNPEERTKMVHDEERRKKAVRQLSFVGKEGGTSVNDHNVMQRQVYLQIRRERELGKKAGDPGAAGGDSSSNVESVRKEKHVEEMLFEEEEEEEEDDDVIIDDGHFHQSPDAPMGSAEKKPSKLTSTSSMSSSPIKNLRSSSKPAPEASAPVAAAPETTTPGKKRKRSAAVEESNEPTPQPEEEDHEEEPEPSDQRGKLRDKLVDEQFAKMVQKRSQAAKRLMEAKKYKNSELSPKKPRKALAYSVAKLASSSNPGTSSAIEPEEDSTPREHTPEPSTSNKKPSPPVRNLRSSVKALKQEVPEAKSTPPVECKVPKLPEFVPFTRGAAAAAAAAAAREERLKEARPLKSVLAKSFIAGDRPSLSRYHVPIKSVLAAEPTAVGAGTERSSSVGAISRPGSSSPGGIFSQRVMGAVTGEKPQAKRPTVLGRRPLILSPRKRAQPASSSTAMPHHRSTPNLAPSPPTTGFLISPGDMEVDTMEEVVDAMGNSEDIPGISNIIRQPALTLAQALELEAVNGAGSTVKDQDFEEISKKMMEETQYYRAMEDAIKGRTVTKMRADMRLSRHCIRQIEAARARARLFGEGTEDYQIYYSNDGAQVLSKTDPKWRDLQQQQPGPSDQ